MDAASIITAVISQGGTDASRATVLSVLNEAYQTQLADSRSFRTFTIYDTATAGVNYFDITEEIYEVHFLSVGDSRPYEPVGGDVYAAVLAGNATATGGIYCDFPGPDGATPRIYFYPVPETNGTSIKLSYSGVAPALTDSALVRPATPLDTHGSLIDGTLAIILARIDERPDLAAPFQQRFDAVTEKIRRRRNARAFGGRPAQIQVRGVHW